MKFLVKPFPAPLSDKLDQPTRFDNICNQEIPVGVLYVIGFVWLLWLINLIGY
jgi:hypothetical protein